MPQSEKPREWWLLRVDDAGMDLVEGPDLLGQPRVRVLEAEPVERELADWRERAEKAEAEFNRESVRCTAVLAELERLKEGIREAATIIDRLRLREEWRLRYADEETKARHIVAESWLAAYCPIPEKSLGDVIAEKSAEVDSWPEPFKPFTTRGEPK